MNDKIYDAVFYEAFDEEEKLLRKLLPETYNCLFTWKTIQEARHAEAPAKVISIRTQSRIPCDWVEDISALISRSTGYEHISEYLLQTGMEIPSAYLPDYAGRAVAEQAMLMWTTLLRNMKLQEESTRQFYRDGLTGSELRKRRITVIGVGRIGGEIIDIAHGLKMHVTGVDIEPRLEMVKQYGLQYKSLEEGLRTAEIVVCAVPLTTETYRLLNYEKLKTMASGGIFINIARGEISPSSDLLKLLDEGSLAGVGLDVYEYEKELAYVLRDNGKLNEIPEECRKSIDASIKLMHHSRAVCTPHNAFNTKESVERKALQTVENLRSFLERGRFITPIKERTVPSR